MRRSVLAFLAAASAVAMSSPAVAGKSNIQTLPAISDPCDVAVPSPTALDCAGYYPQNLIGGSPENIQNAKDAIATLDGPYEWDGDWAAVDATKITTFTNGDQLNFGQTLFGITVIGAHFGNAPGAAGNVSVFWLFDFGVAGVDYITVADVEGWDNSGWSNAAIYTTGGPPAVPEPATWAMMLLGFGAAGTAIRRNRRRNAHITQLA